MSYKNILLIDDDSDDAELFMEAVESLQKEVVCQTENNALKAIEELKTTENLPDLVFVDFSMPAINGAEFIQKVKSEQRLKHIPIVLMSSHSVEVLRKLTEGFEAVQYRTKPNSFQDLVAMLDALI